MPARSCAPRGARLGRLVRRVAGDERGWSLVELMIVCGIAIVVVGVPLTLSVQAVIGQNRATSRSAATNRVEVGVAQMLHDLRHAVTPSTVTSTGATLTLPVRSVAGGVIPGTQTVTWACTSGGSCTRQVGATTTTVIPYVVSASFAPVSGTGATTPPITDPAYVSVTVSVLNSNESGNRAAQVTGTSAAITVTDGVALRNFAL
jgi:hypothetical protein